MVFRRRPVLEARSKGNEQERKNKKTRKEMLKRQNNLFLFSVGMWKSLKMAGGRCESGVGCVSGGCEPIDLETKRTKKRYYCSIELWIIAHWDRKIEDTSSELIEPFRKFIRYRFSFLLVLAEN